MQTRRSLLKRVTLWTAGVVLLLASYVGGAPLVFWTVVSRFPEAAPVMRVVYAPVMYFCDHSDWPGSEAYQEYAVWCANLLGIERF